MIDTDRNLCFRIEHTYEDGTTFTGHRWITTEDRAREFFQAIVPALFGGETARLIGPGGTIIMEADNR